MELGKEVRVLALEVVETGWMVGGEERAGEVMVMVVMKRGMATMALVTKQGTEMVVAPTMQAVWVALDTVEAAKVVVSTAAAA